MYLSNFRYHRPTSLSEAVGLLDTMGQDARVLAGGQSLIPMMKLHIALPDDLIDLDAIGELSELSIEDGTICVGAMVRHRAFEHGSLAASMPILRDTVAGIADRQVRNRGTMCGSIANADPGGDWAPVLLAIGATLDVTGPGGQRSLAIGDFIVDAYTTGLAENEILSCVRIPIPTGRQASGYVALKRRTGDYAIASAAVRIDLDTGGACTGAAVALGSVATKALLVDEATDILRGQSPFERHAAERLGDAAAEACDPFSDNHGTVAYKRSLVKTLVMRALELAARRSRGETVDANSYT